MFFRREAPKNPSFQERIDALRGAGFATAGAPSGGVLITRDGVGVVLRESGDRIVREARTGVVLGSEIGSLVDGGYQKFFRTPSGKNKPATADELKAIHAFEEDLKEAMGQESLYNESLGTVSTFYLYDRVKDRDHGVPKRVWES
jgi:hypothetical protein